MKLREFGISNTDYELVFNVNELANSNDDCAEEVKNWFTGHEGVFKVSNRMISSFANGETIIGISTFSCNDELQEYLYKLCNYIHKNGTLIEHIEYTPKCHYECGRKLTYVLKCFKLGEDGYIETTGELDISDFIYMNQEAYNILADIDL